MEITTADFVAPLHSANLSLFGLVVDDDSRPLAPPWQPDESHSLTLRNQQITITLQDSASRPVPGATFEWTAFGPRIQVDFPPFRADADGRVPIEFQSGILQEIRYTAVTPHGVKILGELVSDDAGNFPASAIVKVAQ